MRTLYLWEDVQPVMMITVRLPTYIISIHTHLFDTVDSLSLTGLVSGQDYFVRIRACALSYVGHTDYVCSAWAYNGFPDSPIGVYPLQIADMIQTAKVAQRDSSSVFLMDGT